MKTYSPPTNKGRIISIDDVNHKTADQAKESCNASAKALKKSARQYAKKQICVETLLDNLQTK